MGRILLHAALFFTTFSAIAQQVNWSHSADYEITDKCISLASDNHSSFYSVVYTNSSGQSGYNETYVYLRKYSNGGTQIWEKKVDPGYYGNVRDVKSDHRGHLYWNISVWGTAGFLSETYPLDGLGSVIVQLDTNGHILRKDQFFDQVYVDFDIDAAGNKYFFGHSSKHVVHFNNDSMIFNSGFPYFIMKCNDQGSLIWYRELSSNYHYWVYGDGPRMKQIAGKIYFAGSFLNSITIGSTQLTANSGADIFYGSIDLNGNFLWSKKIEGSLDETITFLNVSEEKGSKVVFGIDSYGYSSSGPQSSVSIDNQSAAGIHFLALVNENGDASWIESSTERVNSAKFFNSLLYATGDSLVLAKYELNGNLIYSKKETVNGSDILPVENDMVIFGGGIFKTNDLGEFVPWVNYYRNFTDQLICKLDFRDYYTQPVITNGIIEKAAARLKIYPNPAGAWIRIEGITEMNCQVTIYNAYGKKILEETYNPGESIELPGVANGTYFLSITSGKSAVYSGKLVIKR